MPQARDEAGNIWETDEQGNAVRLLQAASTVSAPMTFGTPDPSIPRKEARAEAADARSAAAEARAQAAADRSAREWNATHNPDGSPKAKAQGSGKPMPDGVAKRYEEAINAFAAFDRATGGFQDDYAGNTLTGELENTAQNLYRGIGTPGQAQWWSDFKATDNVLRNALYGASLTAGEKAAYEATTISPRMDPAQIRANLSRRMELARDLLSRRTKFLKANGYDPKAVDALAGEYGPLVNGQAQQRADNEVPGQDNGAPLKAGTDPIDPGSMPPANSPGGGMPSAPRTPWDQPNPTGGMTVASGPSRTIHSDRLSAQVDAMMNAGASKAMIDTVLKQQGFPPINPSDYTAAKKWMQENPGQKYFGANITREEPLGLLAQAAGSAPGAFVAQMADAATAGTVGALAGDKGRGALDAMDQTHPNAAMAGSIVGGITGAASAEAGLTARGGQALAKYAPRVADALYGGLSGFNGAADGKGLQGAAIGAGLGVVGGAAGEKAMSAAGSLARGVRDPAVDYLRARGVPMTAGQVLGQAGPLGRGVKKVEDALTSLPGVGNVIDARRQEGIQGFNRAAFEIGSETTGNQVQDYGAAGLGQLRQAVGDTYDRALNPARIDASDPAMLNDLGAVRNYVQQIPNVNGAQDAANAALDARITGAIDPATGTISGRNFQEAYRGLARTGRERANGDYGYEIGQAMRQGQDALAAALERQNPGAYQGFVSANQANRRMNVLAQAVDAAKNQEEQLFTPAQLNRADAQNATRLTGRVSSASGNRPFAELAEAGQAVLPSKLPDSGTSTRALVGLGLGGAAGGGVGHASGHAGGGAAIGLGATLALMLGGTRGAQRAAERLLVDRPDLAIAIGDSLQRNSRIGSGLGAGASLSLGLEGLVAGK